jgi:uncharacterized membrane protein
MDTPTTIKTLQAVGLTSSLVLGGVYFGSSQVTVPTLYHLPIAHSTSVFTAFYYRGIPPVVTLSMSSAVCFGTLAYMIPAQRMRWASAAVLALAPLVWTRTIMANTVDTLLRYDADQVEREKAGVVGVLALLKAWQWQNFVRSGMAVAGGLLGLQAFLE